MSTKHLFHKVPVLTFIKTSLSSSLLLLSLVAHAGGASRHGIENLRNSRESSVGAMIFDKGKMPKCYVDRANGTFYYFKWNRDPLDREIFVEEFNLKQRKTETVRGAGGRSHTRSYLLYNRYCWQDNRRYFKDGSVTMQQLASIYTGVGDHFDQGDLHTPGRRIMRFRDWPFEEIKMKYARRFKQVMWGARTYRPINIDTGEDFIAAYPPRGAFDRKLNRQITEEFGAGFSGQVYGAWMMSQKKNQVLRNSVLSQMEFLRSNPIVTPLAEKYKDVTFLVVNGWGTPPADDRSAPIYSLYAALERLGLNVAVGKKREMDRLLDNANSLAADLRERLLGGEKIVIISACVGSAETILALDKLRSSFKEFPGKIASVINISGMLEGSFVTEKLVGVGISHGLVEKLVNGFLWDGFGSSPGFKDELFQELSRSGIAEKMEDINSTRDLTQDRLGNYVQKAAKRGLPQNIPYINWVGIPPGQGYAQSEYVAGLQNLIVRPLIQWGYGANDGYVEYPGTNLKDEWFEQPQLNNQTMIFEADHHLTYGKYNGLDLRRSSNTLLLIEAFLHLLADEI